MQVVMRLVPQNLACFGRTSFERTRRPVLVAKHGSIHVSNSDVNASFDMSVVHALDLEDMLQSRLMLAIVLGQVSTLDDSISNSRLVVERLLVDQVRLFRRLKAAERVSLRV